LREDGADGESIPFRVRRGGAITTYSLLKLVHVLAAIVAVGTNVTYFAWLSRVRKHPELALQVLGRWSSPPPRTGRPTSGRQGERW